MGRDDGHFVPSHGDQIELLRAGVTHRGRVWYADQIQILVKWEDGKSSSLPVGSQFIRPSSQGE